MLKIPKLHLYFSNLHLSVLEILILFNLFKKRINRNFSIFYTIIQTLLVKIVYL